MEILELQKFKKNRFVGLVLRYTKQIAHSDSLGGVHGNFVVAKVGTITWVIRNMAFASADGTVAKNYTIKNPHAQPHISDRKNSSKHGAPQHKNIRVLFATRTWGLSANSGVVVVGERVFASAG